MNVVLMKLLIPTVIDSSILVGSLLSLIAPEEIYPGRKWLKYSLILFLFLTLILDLIVRKWNPIWVFLICLGVLLLIYTRRLDLKSKKTYYLSILFSSLSVLIGFKSYSDNLKIVLFTLLILFLSLFEINSIYFEFEREFKKKKEYLRRVIRRKIIDKATIDFILTLILTFLILIIF